MRKMAAGSKSILDPSFRYVPALETDIAATWRRFGFDPRRNAERRAGARQSAAGEAVLVSLPVSPRVAR